MALAKNIFCVSIATLIVASMGDLIELFCKKEGDTEIVPRQLRCLFQALDYLDKETGGGGLSEVYEVIRDKLQQVLNLTEVELARPVVGEKFEALCGLIVKKARPEVFKQELFVHGKAEEVSKGRMAMTFGPEGNIVKSVPEKARGDATEAVRIIPVFGKGRKLGLDVFRLMQEIRNDLLPLNDFCEDAMLTIDGEHLTAWELLKGDGAIAAMIEKMRRMKNSKNGEPLIPKTAFSENMIQNDGDLTIFQEALRKEPLTSEMEKNLKQYFLHRKQWSIYTTFRKVLDELKGIKGRPGHPKCGWQEAKRIIQEAFQKYFNEDFLLDETNIYTGCNDLSDKDIAHIIEANDRVIELLAEKIWCRLPEDLSRKYNRDVLEKIWERVLEHYHSFPKIEPAKGRMLGRRGLTLATKILYHFIGYRMRQVYQLPANEDYEELIREWVSVEHEELMVKIFGEVLQDYRREGGVRDYEKCGNKAQGTDSYLYLYEVPERVNYTFQERFGILKPGEREEANLSIGDLRDPKNWHYFDEFPDLSKKLLIFGVLAYRFFSDTGYLLDLRPDEHVMGKMLLLGVYGFDTGNVRVQLKIMPDGRRVAVVKILDNKDQFKQHRDGIDEQGKPGAAKEAFGLTGKIGKQALERVIGKCVGNIWDLEQKN